MCVSLESLLAEWILSNGPVRPAQETLRVRQETALVVRRFFGNSGASRSSVHEESRCPWCGVTGPLHDIKRHIKRCKQAPRPRN